MDAPVTAPTLVAGYGDVSGEYARYLGLEPGKLMLWAGPDNSLQRGGDGNAGQVAVRGGDVRWAVGVPAV